MRFQFTIRSLLTLVLFVAVLLSMLRMGAMAQEDAARGPVVAVLGWFGWVMYRCGGLAFWLVLLMPTWVSLFLMGKDARRQAGARPFLATVPAGWYCAIIFLSDLHGPAVYLVKVVAVVGTLAAFAALVLSAGRGKYILAVPLGIAIACGTISILFTRP